MDIVDLLAVFSDPETMKNLSSSQRLLAGLVTTVLGMGITFLALIVLQFVTALMGKLSSPQAEITTPASAPADDAGSADTTANSRGEEELVAAITTSIAMLLQTSTTNIVISNIKKIEDTTPTWSKVGIAEQMQNNV